jgi:hypothetical protein
MAMPDTHLALSAADRDFLLALQADALRYFIDNQQPSGLVLDRQANFGPRHSSGLCSTTATGMGFIALALAAAQPHRLLSKNEAIARIGRGVKSALEELPHTDGVLPHFVDAQSGKVAGFDIRSTIDTAWLVAGGLWAAEFLGDSELKNQAQLLYDRIDWRAWTGAGGLIHHGEHRDGGKLACCWDRINGETIFLYVLAAGAKENREWPSAGWSRLGLFRGKLAGLEVLSPDLGLFASQYSLDLLDLNAWRPPGDLDLPHEAALAAEANARICRNAADRWETYRRFWGITAGDGPPETPNQRDKYRGYSPLEELDGTAHITGTIASLEYRPDLVWENLRQAEKLRRLQLRGRYGVANVNLDRSWVSGDTVGIDVGAAILALSNTLNGNQIRGVFHRLVPVQRGIDRLGWMPARASGDSTRAVA